MFEVTIVVSFHNTPLYCVGVLCTINLNTGALQRWLLSKPAKAAISAECDTMAGLHHSFSAHTELDAHR